MTATDAFRLYHGPDGLPPGEWMELLPGRYAGRCWNAESAYVAEGAFGFLEEVIGRHAPGYDHYAFTEVPLETWVPILADLDALAADLDAATRVEDIRGELRFLFKSSEARFAAGFPATARALAALTRELVGWVRARLERHDGVSILGM